MLAGQGSLKNIHNLIKAAVQELPIEEQFLQDLKFGIEKLHEKETRAPSRSYKPSSLNCSRNMYFQIKGEKRDEERMSSCLIGIVQSGSDRHDKIQEATSKLKDLGIDCTYVDVAEYVQSRNLTHLEIVSRQGYETKLLNRDLNLSFLCDGIIRYRGRYYILEIKTETISKWQNRNAVAEEHINQGTAYATCFNINQIIFLYENRDNCDKKAYLLDITEEMKQERVIKKIKECDKYVAISVPPPILKTITRKDCQYCNYKTACQRAGV